MMLRIENLTFRHAHHTEDILHGITFNAEPGKITTILGPNGSGKTTLFRCIAGLWNPKEGAVLFDDRPLSGLSSVNRARLLAIVPQEHEPPFPYSVFDIVLMGRAAHVGLFSAPSKRDYAAADEAIGMVGISHLADRPYTRISGGERQLVLIARALAQDSPILILDEPTSHLDFRNQIVVLEKVRSIVSAKGLIALMTLHDPNLALLFSDQAILISEGIVIAKGNPRDVISAEHLFAMYGIPVEVLSHNGIGFICPKTDRTGGGPAK
jgi:iron complex transport system ATP-binding protein